MSFRPRGHILASIALLAIGTGVDTGHGIERDDVAPIEPKREPKRRGKHPKDRTAPKRKRNRAKGRKPRSKR
jgi:hypothetical protein